MNNMKYTILVLVLVLISYVIWNANKKEPVVTENTNIVSNEEAINICYIWNTEAGDSATLKMAFTGAGGSVVTGSFDYNPAEKDRKVGSFTGTAGPVDPYMMARTAKLIWNANGEGVTNREELFVIFGEGIASPGFGEMMQDASGLYVYKNPEAITYPINLSDTDCNDPAVAN